MTYLIKNDMMKLLKTLIIVSFLCCCIGSGHTGGFFGPLEFSLIINSNAAGGDGGLVLLVIITVQIISIIGIFVDSYTNIFTLSSTVLYTSIVIFASIISERMVILINGVFLTTVAIYLGMLVKSKRQKLIKERV